MVTTENPPVTMRPLPDSYPHHTGCTGPSEMYCLFCRTVYIWRGNSSFSRFLQIPDSPPIHSRFPIPCSPIFAGFLLDPAMNVFVCLIATDVLYRVRCWLLGLLSIYPVYQLNNRTHRCFFDTGSVLLFNWHTVCKQFMQTIFELWCSHARGNNIQVVLKLEFG